MIAALTPLLLTLGPVALLLAMAVIFAETGLLVGFFLPGDSLLFTVGVVAATGAIPLPFWLIASGLFTAAVLGDQVGYLIGRRIGPRVFARTDSRFFAASHATKAQAFFAKHGPKAVVLARFVPVVRTFSPVVAGVAEMPRRTFTAYNAAGGLAWTVGLLVVGHFLGGVPIIAAHVELFAIAMVALCLIPAAAPFVRHRLQRARRTGGQEQAESRRTATSSMTR
ncbi:MAG: VTT domain-containing protein [Nocardioides sp.]|uniref:VTT domain-containing protein n=1 Tax=Nocardioides sp. TaxID=35761 RepID=UPI0032653867